jgi:hypothetical protein
MAMLLFVCTSHLQVTEFGEQLDSNLSKHRLTSKLHDSRVSDWVAQLPTRLQKIGAADTIVSQVGTAPKLGVQVERVCVCLWLSFKLCALPGQMRMLCQTWFSHSRPACGWLRAMTVTAYQAAESWCSSHHGFPGRGPAFFRGGARGGGHLPAGHTQCNKVNPTAGGLRQSLTNVIPPSQEVLACPALKAGMHVCIW